MPRIRCLYINCVFLDDGYCSAGSIELDPDEGCITYQQEPDLLEDEDADEEWEDLGYDEEVDDDDDLWLDEDF